MKTTPLLCIAVILGTLSQAQEQPKPTATPRVIILLTEEREHAAQERASAEKRYESGKMDKAAYDKIAEKAGARIEKIDREIKEAKASADKGSRAGGDK